jgi:UPF0176 protein
MNQSHLVLAFYHITPVDCPETEVKIQHAFCKDHDLMGRVYIADHGINGQMSATPKAAKAYMEWLKSRTPFEDVTFKLHDWHEHCFPRMTIKTRPKLVAIDSPIDWSTRGKHISPQEWRDLMESEERPPLIDVRNDYEWDVGHFEGSERPPCQTFRHFENWADDLKERHDPQKPLMMCCTGGIRCELFSSMLIKRGFEKVYQLDGGIINYGLQEGNKHFEGKLFVFDDRLVVPISDEPTNTISTCIFCEKKADHYINCANMDCNELFISCPTCLDAHQGCCCTNCISAPRVRPHQPNTRHKPFRKKHLAPPMAKPS